MRTASSEEVSSYCTDSLRPTTTVWRSLRGASHTSGCCGRAASERQGEKARLRDTLWNTLCTRGGDLQHRPIQPIEQDRHVVRGEVSDHSVALIETEVHPRGSDEVDVSELSGANELDAPCSPPGCTRTCARASGRAHGHGRAASGARRLRAWWRAAFRPGHASPLPGHGRQAS